MRKTLVIMTLVLALLGTLGVEAASSSAIRPVVAYVQMLAGGAGVGGTACGGGSSSFCQQPPR